MFNSMAPLYRVNFKHLLMILFNFQQFKEPSTLKDWLL